MISSAYNSDVYDNRNNNRNTAPVIVSHTMIPETVYYPNLPLIEPVKDPIPEPNLPIPVPKIPIPDPIEKPNNDIQQNDVKLFYESKTRELILTQSKSSLDLFKIIHHTLEDFQIQIKTQTESIIELSNIICKQQETVNMLHDSIGSLSKQMDESKEKIEQQKEVKKDPKPSPFLKKSTSFSSVGQKNFPRPK